MFFTISQKCMVARYICTFPTNNRSEVFQDIYRSWNYICLKSNCSTSNSQCSVGFRNIQLGTFPTNSKPSLPGQRLWFHLILKINMFLSFHISTLQLLHPKLNYRRVLHDFSIDELEAKPSDCFRHNSPFKYSPADHGITGDLSIINNENLRKILANGQDLKYRET